ncbi:hypothetical protein K7X08_005067 [Anisodus acutangulus]|uniref:Uncharacterized protein n=1 Tax=Anisodus acutangulus TaxID=402998 RepID=A0A9Q1RJA1_9SOLA|nr:hypothetical protein K7X08_005067 [Anisodus acutangulus]
MICNKHPKRLRKSESPFPASSTFPFTSMQDLFSARANRKEIIQGSAFFFFQGFIVTTIRHLSSNCCLSSEWDSLFRYTYQHGMKF